MCSVHKVLTMQTMTVWIWSLSHLNAYLHVCTHWHAHTYTNLHNNIHISMHTYTYVYINTIMCTHAWILVHMYTYSNMHTYSNMYTYKHIYPHSHLHAYLNTHINTLRCTYMHVHNMHIRAKTNLSLHVLTWKTKKTKHTSPGTDMSSGVIYGHHHGQAWGEH